MARGCPTWVSPLACGADRSGATARPGTGPRFGVGPLGYAAAMSKPDHHTDPAMNQPGSQDQPGEFIDTPHNQPGDQDDGKLSDVVDPSGGAGDSSD